MNTRTLILERLQRLLCLGLERTPATELIPGLVRVWTERLGMYSPERLEKAFDVVEASTTIWPVPAQIIAALPIYAAPARRASAEFRIAPDPEYCERARQRVAEIIAQCAADLKVQL